MWKFCVAYDIFSWYYTRNGLLFTTEIRMKNLQDVFADLQAKKQEKKQLQSVYKDTLKNSEEYVHINDQLAEIKEQKKAIEFALQAEMGSDYDRLEDLKLEIKSLQEMLSDIALTQYMKGEEVKIVDGEQEYEPVMKVSFKKVS